MAGMRILQGCALVRSRGLEAESVNCCVTSPPYWGLRDYKTEPKAWPEISFEIIPGFGSITIPAMTCSFGLEPSPNAFIGHAIQIFREVKRILREDGTLWLNIGDSYCASPGQRKQGVERNDVAGWKQQTNTGCLTIGSRTADGSKPKDLVGIPWLLAFALRADGWYLRQEIIWAKPNPMPESVTDRCTKSHESLFLLSKSSRYYFDHEAIKEPCTQDERRPSFRGGAYVNNSTFDNAEGGKSTDTGNIRVGPTSWKGSEFHTGKTAEPQLGRASKNRSHKGVTEYESSETEEHRTKAGLMKIAEVAYPTRNKRDVWTIGTQPFPEAHFATFPPKLIEPCILAGCPENGVVLDPFSGAGTTGLVALRHKRSFIGIELNPDYIKMANNRILKELLS